MTKAAAWSIRVLLGLLGALSLVIEVIFVPMIGREIVGNFPEAEPLLVLGFIWSILAIGCGQAILVIVWRLVSFAENGNAFSADAVPWVKASIAISIAALVLFVTAFVAFNVLGFTPPSIMYGLIGLVLLCLVFALIMRAVLRLYRRAADLHEEMAEVI